MPNAITTPTPSTVLGDSPVDSEASLYNVVLLDDDEHTYEYVVEMLHNLFFLPESVAFQHAIEVDTAGRTTVMTCELPQAEFARDQIHGYGADPRMPKSKGSMSAIIEPATRPATL